MTIRHKYQLLPIIEVLGFNASDKDYNLLKNFIEDATVLVLDNDIIDITIDIRKKYKIKLPDAIIAATAIAKNSILISRNIADFKNIEGIQIINPHAVNS